MSSPTTEQVMAALATVNDPEIKRPITDLGMVDAVEVGDDGTVRVTVLLTVAGIKLPMRPFFAVASVLTFYLCFKFLGTGIHALQVADVLDATTSDSLPSNDTLGLFPTWQTTIPQLVLLLAGVTFAVWGRINDLALSKTSRSGARADA